MTIVQSQSGLTVHHDISIAVLDDDLLAIQSIYHNTALLLPQSSIIWNTTSPNTAVQQCLHPKTAPDVLLIDLSLSYGSAITTCRRIRQATGDIGIIGLTTVNPNLYRHDIVDLGIQALISKAQFNRLIKLAAVQVSQGLAFDPASWGLLNAKTAHERALHNTRTWQKLSSRELEILRLFSQGLTAYDIADKLAISRNTVYAHTSRAIQKLHAHTRYEALSICQRYGTI